MESSWDASWWWGAANPDAIGAWQRKSNSNSQEHENTVPPPAVHDASAPSITAADHDADSANEEEDSAIGQAWDDHPLSVIVNDTSRNQVSIATQPGTNGPFCDEIGIYDAADSILGPHFVGWGCNYHELATNVKDSLQHAASEGHNVDSCLVFL